MARRWLGGIAQFLRREFDAGWPVFLFFLTGFSLMILIIKLALAEFSIGIAVLSNAMIGALIAAKAALVLDETSLARSLEKYRRIVAVVAKTLFYAALSVLLGYVERFLEAFHKVHTLGGAILYVVSNANHFRLLAWALGTSIVFGLYFSCLEISRRMGKGELFRLFFNAPASAEMNLSNVSSRER